MTYGGESGSGALVDVDDLDAVERLRESVAVPSAPFSFFIPAGKECAVSEVDECGRGWSPAACDDERAFRRGPVPRCALRGGIAEQLSFVARESVPGSEFWAGEGLGEARPEAAEEARATVGRPARSEHRRLATALARRRCGRPEGSVWTVIAICKGEGRLTKRRRRLWRSEAAVLVAVVRSATRHRSHSCCTSIWAA